MTISGNETESLFPRFPTSLGEAIRLKFSSTFSINISVPVSPEERFRRFIPTLFFVAISGSLAAQASFQQFCLVITSCVGY
jgi:hypothetical protein